MNRREFLEVGVGAIFMPKGDIVNAFAKESQLVNAAVTQTFICSCVYVECFTESRCRLMNGYNYPQYSSGTCNF